MAVIDEPTEARAPKDILTCPARWSPAEKGFIEVRHPTTGEVAEIPYEQATPVWREDIRRIGAARRARGR